MIDYEKMFEASQDLSSEDMPEEGYPPDEVERRYELTGISWEAFKAFALERLSVQLKGDEDASSGFVEGYMTGAVDFFIVGVLCGKAESIEDDFMDELNNN